MVPQVGNYGTEHGRRNPTLCFDDIVDVLLGLANPQPRVGNDFATKSWLLLHDDVQPMPSERINSPIEKVGLQCYVHLWHLFIPCERSPTMNEWVTLFICSSILDVHLLRL